MTTTNIARNADDAIARSVSHNEIARAEASAETVLDLMLESDDSVQSDGEWQFWGTRDDGAEWRVHVELPFSLRSRVEGGRGDDRDTGRVGTYDVVGDDLVTLVHWDSGVSTPTSVRILSAVD
jgi:hypothetical protein